MLGNIKEMLKSPHTIRISYHLPYNNVSAEWLASGLDRFLECRKCKILVITQALVLCLIYIYALVLGHCIPLKVVCIYQTNHSCLCYNY